MTEIMRDIEKISELLKNVSLYRDFADLYERQDIYQIIFSELSISNNILVCKLNSGFKPFESRFIHSSARDWI